MGFRGAAPALATLWLGGWARRAHSPKRKAYLEVVALAHRVQVAAHHGAQRLSAPVALVELPRQDAVELRRRLAARVGQGDVVACDAPPQLERVVAGVPGRRVGVRHEAHGGHEHHHAVLEG